MSIDFRIIMLVGVSLMASCGVVKVDESNLSSETNISAYGESWIDKKTIKVEQYLVVEGDGLVYKELRRELIREGGNKIDLRESIYSLHKDGEFKNYEISNLEAVNLRLIVKNNKIYVLVEDSQDEKRLTDCFAYYGDPERTAVSGYDYYGWGEFDPMDGRFYVDKFIPLNLSVSLYGYEFSGDELESIELSYPLDLYCNNEEKNNFGKILSKYKKLLEDAKNDALSK
ncbi:hypothetical protein [Alcanivorax sediminis]|uniref:Lipoprotein n=1 Tax=Alcanivorax sediminis TaxID=2663008 RepID=A0A6N7LSJ2_9GAMM|nr:hypothetical protein [Alcanivorax sediminis]MQX53283.1 hypothetical protein [Alcanivorax sediminis]